MQITRMEIGMRTTVRQDADATHATWTWGVGTFLDGIIIVLRIDTREIWKRGMEKLTLSWALFQTRDVIRIIGGRDIFRNHNTVKGDTEIVTVVELMEMQQMEIIQMLDARTEVKGDIATVETVMEDSAEEAIRKETTSLFCLIVV